MPDDSLRKAAVLVRSLDTEAAAALISQLSAAEAKALRAAIRELGSVADDEREMLLNELRDKPVASRRAAGGVELELSSVCESTSLDPLPPPAPESLTPAPTPSPFSWLDEGDLPTLAQRLAREQISTVALVLSLLPARRAGGLLSALPAEMQTESLARLAELGDVDPASLQLVESDLAEWLREHKACQRRRQDRQTTIAAILQHSPHATCDKVVASLERVGAQWVTPLRASIQQARKSVKSAPGNVRSDSRLRPGRQVDALRTRVLYSTPQPSPTPSRDKRPLPPFASLTQLGAKDFAEVLRACGSTTCVLALADADESFHRQMRQWLPASHYRELVRRIHDMTQVRVRDIDAAQQAMVRMAVEMTRAGRIVWAAAAKSVDDSTTITP